VVAGVVGVLVLAGGFLVKKAFSPAAVPVVTSAQPEPPPPVPLPSAVVTTAPSPASTAPPSEHAQALAEAARLLEARSFAEAAQAARAILAQAPGNDEAASIEKRAQAALDKIVEGRRRARASLDAGKPDQATAALLELLKLAPNDPEARRLSADLDRYAKKQADDALAKVRDARSRAQQARPELAPDAFETAKRLDAEGQRLFDGKQFSQAVARLGEAAEAYGRAETEARAEAERQRVENERQKAAEAERQRLAALAAQKPTPSPVAVVDEAAQRQAEEARRARQDRQAVEALLQRYKGSVEARDFEALKATWPTAPEKQLRQGFQLARSWRLDLQPTDVQINGEVATVTCSRRDEMVSTEGTKIAPRTSTAKFNLRKRAGSWIIESIQ
jgi:tetratricopeptide (TPR) repeat protein